MKIFDLVHYIINFNNRTQKEGITNLKLQKILYFVWIEYYKYTGKELFDNDFCAWQLGPVIPEVYYQYCLNTALPLRDQPEPQIESFIDLDLINFILKKYLPLSTYTLVEKTRRDGGAWDMTLRNKDYKLFKTLIINFEDIIKYECECNR